MPDNTMRMTATLVDKVTGPLKQIRSGMTDTGKSFDKGLADPTKRTNEHFAIFGKQSSAMRRELRAFKDVIGGVSPSIGKLTSEIGSFSIGAGSAVGAVAAFGAATALTAQQLGKFAAGMVNMRFVARETDQTVSSLKRFELAAARFNIPAEAADAALRSFASTYTQFRARQGELYTQLNKLDPETFSKIWNAKGVTEASDQVFAAMERMRTKFKGAEGEQKARLIAGWAFSNEDIARMRNLPEIYKEIDRSFNKGAFEHMSAEAKKFHDEMVLAGEAVDATTTRVLDHLYPAMTKAVSVFSRLITPIDKPFHLLTGAERQKAADDERLRNAFIGPTLSMMPHAPIMSQRDKALANWNAARKAAPAAGLEPLSLGGMRERLGLPALGAGAAGAGTPTPGAPGQSGSLADDRTKFAEELKNPAVRDRLLALTQTEVGSQGPQAQQAFMESVVNRASARGQTISQTMSPSYYPSLGDPSKLTDEQRSRLGSTLGLVQGGSNLSKGATGNASGGVRFGGGPQTASFGGERFGIEAADLKRASGRMAARGSANFMHGQFGAVGENLTTVDTAAGKLKANAAAAPHLAAFVNDMAAAGAPIKDIGGFNARKIAGSGRWSQHAYGNAIDIDQQSRNVVSPAFRKWANENPDAMRAAMAKHGIISGGDWKNPDFGHFEWGGGAGKDRESINSALGGEINSKVTGTGKLTVDVNAPRGTKVNAQGGGLFKDVQMNRNMQMTPAASGPSESVSSGGPN